MLFLKTFLKRENVDYPRIDVCIKNSTLESDMDIIYDNKNFENDFFIQNLTNDNIGITSQYNLNFEDLKFYLFELFSSKRNIKNDVQIKKIFFTIKKDKKKLFYDYTKGLVWGNEKCIDCNDRYRSGKLQGNDEDYQECMDILNNSDCEEKILYRPKANFKDEEKQVKEQEEDEEEKEVVVKQKTRSEILKEKSKLWTCKSCTSSNNQGDEKCKVCGFGKNEFYDEKKENLKNKIKVLEVSVKGLTFDINNFNKEYEKYEKYQDEDAKNIIIEKIKEYEKEYEENKTQLSQAKKEYEKYEEKDPECKKHEEKDERTPSFYIEKILSCEKKIKKIVKSINEASD